MGRLKQALYCVIVADAIVCRLWDPVHIQDMPLKGSSGVLQQHYIVVDRRLQVFESSGKTETGNG